MPDVKNDKNNIVLAENMGLGNRLQFMASCMRIFDIHEFTLYWPSEGWVSAKFSDLFDFKWDYEYKEDNTKILDFMPNLEPPLSYTEGWRLYIDKNDGLPKYFSKISHDAPHGYSMDLEYNRIPEKILDIYRPFFQRLKPSSQVKSRYESVDLPENFVAVQVRNTPFWNNLKRNVSLNEYFKVMDKYPQNTKFYLSAFSSEILDVFIKKYGNRIIYLNNKDYNSMTDATAELFIMAQAADLICAYKSTFPCIAWWLGNCNAKVIVIGITIKTKFSFILKKLMRILMLK